MNNKVGLSTLIFSSIGSIIGSGWLFGPAHAAAIAGPAAIFSWLLATFVISIIALNLVEISTTTPNKMSGMGYYLRYTHGALASFLIEWSILLSFISVVPSEATASTQYLSDLNFSWTHALFNYQLQILTSSGLLFASGLCIIYFLINYYSLKFLANSINAITLFKISVPIIVIISFLLVSFHSGNFHAIGDHSLTPYGISSIFTATTTAGLVYAFNGFQNPISFAAEAKNPKRNIPLAIIGSILICTIIYVLLQYVYLVSMPQHVLLTHGWNNLSFSSPFASLALLLNINLIALLIYTDAFISPAGTGLIFTAISARVLVGLAEHMPRVIGKVDKQSGLPKIHLIIVLLASFIALWLLPSWNKLVSIVSVAFVISYAMVTVCTSSFRKLSPEKVHDQVIHIPFMHILSPLGFILATFMLYWSRWPLNGEVIILVLIGLPIYLYYAKKQNEPILLNVKKSLWIIIYLVVVALFSYIGSSSFGGMNLIPDKIDHIILAILALIFFYWGRSLSYKTQEYIDEIESKRNSA